MIVEKKLAILFWVGVVIASLIASGFIFNAWGESFVNDVGHTCYSALAIIDENKNIDYDNAKLYYICYQTLEERLLGNSTYYKDDIPDYIIPELTGMSVSLNEGNTQVSENLNESSAKNET